MNDPGFSVSAAFLDYDRDGWLDLYVGELRALQCREQRCLPRLDRRPRLLFPARVSGHSRIAFIETSRVGAFLDVTARALKGGHFGPALGVSTADFNGDGWMDVFVANDGQQNQLWMNQRDGTFENQALLAGVAFNADGKAVAGMGVDAGDFDNDGDEDLFLTTLTTEANTLFVNDGTGMFEDRTAWSGLGAPSLPYTGWGAAWIDVDNDRWLDVVTVNGTIQAVEGRAGPFPYDQRKQLFRNLGNGRFDEISERAGAAFQLSEVGRGAAFGDVDNDGAVDLVVANANGPFRVFLNRRGRRSHWLGLRLSGGATTRRDMLGARVTVMLPDGTTLWRRARSDGSYASANDPRVVIGLGGLAGSVRARVAWPDGHVEEWTELPVDQWTTLTQGGGQLAGEGPR